MLNRSKNTISPSEKNRIINNKLPVIVYNYVTEFKESNIIHFLPFNLSIGWQCFLSLPEEEQDLSKLIQYFIESFYYDINVSNIKYPLEFPLKNNHPWMRHEIIKFLNLLTYPDNLICDETFESYKNKWRWGNKDFVDVIKLAYYF